MSAVSEQAKANKRQRDRERYRAKRDHILARARERYQQRRGEYLDYQRRYRAENSDRLRQGQFERHIKQKYGVTLEWYARTWVAQDYSCAICGDTRDDLYVDHDHASGRARGLLCPTCNAQLHGVERDGWLDLARQYLARFA